jgi:hypothetical protein
MAAPSNIASVADPVQRTRLYMDWIEARWEALRALNPSVTESQFWLDLAAWQAYYQLRRGGEFGINDSDWQGAWSDTEAFEQKAAQYEAKFGPPIGGGLPPPLPPKPGLPEPVGPSSSSSSSKPWELAAGLGAIVLIGALIYWEI